jgi:hypothetical protein
MESTEANQLLLFHGSPFSQFRNLVVHVKM